MKFLALIGFGALAVSAKHVEESKSVDYKAAIAGCIELFNIRSKSTRCSQEQVSSPNRCLQGSIIINL